MRGRGNQTGQSFTHTMTPRNKAKEADENVDYGPDISPAEAIARAEKRLSNHLDTIRANIPEDKEIYVLFDRSGSVTADRDINQRQLEIAELLQKEKQISLLAFTTESFDATSGAAELLQFKAGDKNASEEDMRQFQTFGGGGTPTAVALDYVSNQDNVAGVVVITDGFPNDAEATEDYLYELKLDDVAVTAILQSPYGHHSGKIEEMFDNANVEITPDNVAADFSVQVLADNFELLEANVLGNLVRTNASKRKAGEAVSE